MFFVVLPFVVFILITSIVFIVPEPSILTYAIVTGVDVLMIFVMIKAYFVYLKTSHNMRDVEFAQEMNEMIKRVHSNRDKFTKDELVMQLEHINRMINEYNLVHQDIIVEPINIQDFLQNPNENPN